MLTFIFRTTFLDRCVINADIPAKLLILTINTAHSTNIFLSPVGCPSCLVSHGCLLFTNYISSVYDDTLFGTCPATLHQTIEQPIKTVTKNLFYAYAPTVLSSAAVVAVGCAAGSGLVFLFLGLVGCFLDGISAPFSFNVMLWSCLGQK